MDELASATEDDLDEMIDLDGMVFGSPWPEAERELVGPTLDLDRFRIVRDGGRIVAIAGSYAQEVTVPGPTPVRAAGVTWVGVAPTHRRRGILGRLMAELHRDADERGEPISMLTASEGGIYERFGYGIASYHRTIEIDRRRTQVRPELQPPPGAVALSGLDDPVLSKLFDHYRRGRVGEIDRTAAADALIAKSLGDGVTVVRHADGFATWKVSAEWHEGHPAHHLALHDLVATTPEAHAALWHTVLSVDLVGPITSRRAVPLDDPLPHLLTDPRALRTTNLNDMLWLHLLDVRAALASRTWYTDDVLTIEVDLGDRSERWRVDGDPTSSEVDEARTPPDLALDRASLGAIYLGGVRPSALALAGKVRPRDDAALRRADAFFLADRLPHCSTGF